MSRALDETTRPLAKYDGGYSFIFPSQVRDEVLHTVHDRMLAARGGVAPHLVDKTTERGSRFSRRTTTRQLSRQRDIVMLRNTSPIDSGIDLLTITGEVTTSQRGRRGLQGRAKETILQRSVSLVHTRDAHLLGIEPVNRTTYEVNSASTAVRTSRELLVPLSFLGRVQYSLLDRQAMPHLTRKSEIFPVEGEDHTSNTQRLMSMVWLLRTAEQQMIDFGDNVSDFRQLDLIDRTVPLVIGSHQLALPPSTIQYAENKSHPYPLNGQPPLAAIEALPRENSVNGHLPQMTP